MGVKRCCTTQTDRTRASTGSHQLSSQHAPIRGITGTDSPYERGQEGEHVTFLDPFGRGAPCHRPACPETQSSNGHPRGHPRTAATRSKEEGPQKSWWSLLGLSPLALAEILALLSLKKSTGTDSPKSWADTSGGRGTFDAACFEILRHLLVVASSYHTKTDSKSTS